MATSIHARKFAIVTGASSGIGYELAAQFAQNGYDLLVVAEDDGITQAAEDLKALGTDVQSAQCDLASTQGVERFWSTVKQANRPLHAAVLNAGVGVNGKFIETEFEEELNLINLNVISTVHLAKLVCQYMEQRGEAGRILITSSVASTMPGPYMAIYNASKAFVQSFSHALHYELKEKGITVTALMPGATETNFFHRAGMEDTKIGVEEKDDPAEVARLGFEALMDGKPQIIAGSLKTRVMNQINDLLPEQFKARQEAKSAKPGSANEA